MSRSKKWRLEWAFFLGDSPDCPWAVHGIQEVSGSIPLISTKNHRFHLESMVFLYFSACFVLGVFALDNKWTTDLLNFFFLTAGRKKLWHLSKKK